MSERFDEAINWPALPTEIKKEEDISQDHSNSQPGPIIAPFLCSEFDFPNSNSRCQGLALFSPKIEKEEKVAAKERPPISIVPFAPSSDIIKVECGLNPPPNREPEERKRPPGTVKKFICKVCNFECLTEIQHRSHVAWAHGMRKRHSKNDVIASLYFCEEWFEEDLTCPMCNQKLFPMKQLALHMVNDHFDRSLIIHEEVAELKELLCGMYCKETKKFRCNLGSTKPGPECLKRFTTALLLKLHLQQQHGEFFIKALSDRNLSSLLAVKFHQKFEDVFSEAINNLKRKTSVRIPRLRGRKSIALNRSEEPSNKAALKECIFCGYRTDNSDLFYIHRTLSHQPAVIKHEQDSHHQRRREQRLDDVIRAVAHPNASKETGRHEEVILSSKRLRPLRCKVADVSSVPVIPHQKIEQDNSQPLSNPIFRRIAGAKETVDDGMRRCPICTYPQKLTYREHTYMVHVKASGSLFGSFIQWRNGNFYCPYCAATSDRFYLTSEHIHKFHPEKVQLVKLETYQLDGHIVKRHFKSGKFWCIYGCPAKGRMSHRTVEEHKLHLQVMHQASFINLLNELALSELFKLKTWHLCTTNILAAGISSLKPNSCLLCSTVCGSEQNWITHAAQCAVD